MATYLEFEKPIAELDGKIAELKHVANGGDINIAEEVAKLQGKTEKLLKATYAKLTPGRRRRWPGTRSGPISATMLRPW
jgi:acetyl-CoA carboxylase carboxyl transferase subunit alpha